MIKLDIRELNIGDMELLTAFWNDSSWKNTIVLESYGSKDEISLSEKEFSSIASLILGEIKKGKFLRNFISRSYQLCKRMVALSYNFTSIS